MFQTSLIVSVKIKNYLSKGEILAEESYYILVILLLDGQVLLFFISGAGLDSFSNGAVNAKLTAASF